jgi:hypothetical protein
VKLDSFSAVEHALTRYGDHLRFVDGVGHPAELRWRMARLSREEVVVLVRWYLERARPEIIAHDLARSTLHVCRCRAEAIERLAALAQVEADPAEFT